MDQIFWNDLRNGKKIDALYWAKREKAQDFIKNPELEQEKDKFILHKRKIVFPRLVKFLLRL